MNLNYAWGHDEYAYQVTAAHGGLSLTTAQCLDPALRLHNVSAQRVLPAAAACSARWFIAVPWRRPLVHSNSSSRGQALTVVGAACLRSFAAQFIKNHTDKLPS